MSVFQVRTAYDLYYIEADSFTEALSGAMVFNTDDAGPVAFFPEGAYTSVVDIETMRTPSSAPMQMFEAGSKR